MMLGWNQPLLINILGHAAGALIFGIFLVLLYSGRGWSGAHGRHLTGLAGGLSLVWNLGSLLVLAWPALSPEIAALIAAVSFSVLSLLPAVLLHLSVKDKWPGLIASGYLLSTVAVAMHFREIQGNAAALHQKALLLITIGFLMLTGAAVVRAALRKDAGERSGIRLVAAMCLALFAMSFVHFGQGHASQVWSSELVIHHAGIPLALFVLLQDYRFVLLDAFVRFLANALLAAVFAGLLMAAALRLAPPERITGKPLAEAFLLTSLCFFLIFFAWLRNGIQRWLTNAIFRHGHVAGLAVRIRECPAFASEGQYLDWAAAAIATALETKDYAVAGPSELEAAADLHRPVLATVLPSSALSRWNWAEAVLPLRLSPGRATPILLGRRRGGKRYLGEDLDVLASAAAEIAERVEWLRQQELNRLVSQAELRALQSQINPHFLFNALNALYGTIPREARGARRMVLNLSDIFRYFLQSDRTFVPLRQEMQIVRAYLEVEQLRLGDRLTMDIRMEEAALDAPIPVLSVQPLVENAIKHGVAPASGPGFVRIAGEVRGRDLKILVENSGSTANADKGGTGVGIKNVRRRLEICYGSAASLRLTAHAEKTSVELSIPLAAVTTDRAVTA